MSDFTYVENVSHAHICAAEALDSRMVFVDVAGKVTIYIHTRARTHTHNIYALKISA